MNGFLARLARSTHAATAAEFAMVVPLLILFLLGIVDAGRLMWTWNRAEKATQMGVRFAAVTDYVPQNLPTHDFALSDGIPGGQPVPTSAFSSTVCKSGSCTGWIYNPTAFANIVARMQAMMPEITAADVTVTYQNIGLGYAGDPNGSDVAPLVTVRLQRTYQPSLMFGGSLNLDTDAALTMEDGSGTVAN